MKNIASLLCCAVALATGAISSSAGEQPCSLSSLGWMAGNWHNAATPERAQERWTIAPGDVLMGAAWEFPAGKTGYAEVMTIRGNGDGLAMYLRHFDGGLSKAWEERDAAMVFIVAHCGPNEVVFDGDGAHVGEHMTYKRSGDQLTIIGDFLHHGEAHREEWHMVRAAE